MIYFLQPKMSRLLHHPIFMRRERSRRLKMQVNTTALNQILVVCKVFLVLFVYSSLFKSVIASVTSVLADGMHWVLNDFVIPVGVQYLYDFGELLIDWWFLNPFRYMLIGARFLVMVFPEIKTHRATLSGPVTTTTTIFRDIASKVPDSNSAPKLAMGPEAPSEITKIPGDPLVSGGVARDAPLAGELYPNVVLPDAYELPSSLKGWSHNYLNELNFSRPVQLIENSSLSDSTRLTALCDATSAIAGGNRRSFRVWLICLLTSSWEGLSRPDGGFRAAFVAGTIPYLLYIYSLLTITVLLPPVIVYVGQMLVWRIMDFGRQYSIAFHGPRIWFSAYLLITIFISPSYLIASVVYTTFFLQVYANLAAHSWVGTIVLSTILLTTFMLLYRRATMWLEDLTDSITAYHLVEEHGEDLEEHNVHTWLLPNWFARLTNRFARFIYRLLLPRIGVYDPEGPDFENLLTASSQVLQSVGRRWLVVREYVRRA
ncbi:hypothetical protein F4809DRAFT_631505 [Biscogniauxia mediterranea]|nr:hypothetical protein F4809DRAFT_631505 [Biscogniauxia mediterranea]